MAAARRRLANEGEADRIERAMMAGVAGARPVETGGLRLTGVRCALFHRLTQLPGEHLRADPGEPRRHQDRARIRSRTVGGDRLTPAGGSIERVGKFALRRSPSPGLRCLGGKVAPSGLCPSLGAARLAERERAGKVVVRDAGLACGLRG
jgi:hypothetical protein